MWAQDKKLKTITTTKRNTVRQAYDDLKLGTFATGAKRNVFEKAYNTF